jgi:hypothetical protein
MRTCEISVMRHKLIEHLQRCVGRSVKFLLLAFPLSYFLHTTRTSKYIVQNLQVATGKRDHGCDLHCDIYSTLRP